MRGGGKIFISIFLDEHFSLGEGEGYGCSYGTKIQISIGEGMDVIILPKIKTFY